MPVPLTLRANLAPRAARQALMWGALLWAIPMIVIAALIAHDPTRHTVTLNSYHLASAAWWKGQNLYIGPAGMNYLPHFAILYSPFHFLPLRASEILWRACAAAALGFGLFQLMRALFGAAAERPFFWASLLAAPLCLGALRNGNANALFGGLTLLAIVAVLRERWWVALAWMTLAVALKPLGIVLLMLAVLVYKPLRWRAPLAFLALAIFPFLFGHPDYVASQFHEAWKNLRACAAVTENRFADLNGILRTLGTPMPAAASTAVRVIAGALTAALWWWGARRLAPLWRGLWLYALATGYLMVFNPMNEANSYAILAPALAAWAICFLCSNEVEERKRGVFLACMILSMGLLPNLVRPIFGNYFALVWHPAMTIVFIGVLVHYISGPRRNSLNFSS
ncbi:MAG TPA: glycosyltransferase family 87 protein [Verrucomicrobiae bacterium]|nr:glycosyltransferase family 87 protein [Verrucomicrobiae bacterium]